MALASLIYYQPKSVKLSKSIKEILLEETIFLREKAIIPMLEAENANFDQKFTDAVQYFSFYVIKTNEILGFKVARFKHTKKIAEFFLKVLYTTQEQFSHINDDLLRSAILDALSKIVDYFLLAREESINV